MAVTRLGLHGAPAAPYASFAGKVAAALVGTWIIELPALRTQITLDAIGTEIQLKPIATELDVE